ncbi:MAG: hypothetical protein D6724_06615 [Armatimonadetes bacterium]|nr:MAG: hypothetical protein D6724_06615 [Armatimonadota bacterium]
MVLFLAVSPCVVFSVFLAKFFIWPPEPQYEILARQRSPDGSLEFVLAKESTRDWVTSLVPGPGDGEVFVIGVLPAGEAGQLSQEAIVLRAFTEKYPLEVGRYSWEGNRRVVIALEEATILFAKPEVTVGLGRNQATVEISVGLGRAGEGHSPLPNR